MTLKVHNVTFDCADPVKLARFWAGALGYVMADWCDENGAAVSDPNGTGVRLLFIPVPEGKAAKNRLHMDVTPPDVHDVKSMEAEVERLITLGATVAQSMHETTGEWTGTWTILQDPEGNEFCVEGPPHTQAD